LNGKRKAKFITFEGIDGCGKSTQAKRLFEHLKRIGVPAKLTLEPGGTHIGSLIRNILLDPENKHMDYMTELFLYMADRSQHIKEVIAPCLNNGIWVISDRFYDATVAYQGFGRGIDKEFIEMLNKKVCQDIQPDITFLLDCPVKVAMERKSKNDRFDQEDLLFYQKVREGYLYIAEKYQKRVIVLDATRSIYEIEKVVLKIVKNYLF